MAVNVRVKQVLRKTLLLTDDQLTPGARLVEDLGMTSLDRFELIMAIEDEFGLELTSEEQESIQTVGDLIKRIEVHVAA